MARQESDREDLMREATALQRRAEFRVAGFADTVIAGYRRDGALSIYFGPDPCYHFDRSGRLRRAFIRGHLYRTQGDSLSRLTRVRTAKLVELQRHDLTAAELAQWLADVSAELRRLHAALPDAVCLQEVPINGDMQASLSLALASLLQSPVRLAPPIAGRP